MRNRLGIAGLLAAMLLTQGAGADDKVTVAMSNTVGILFVPALVAKEFGFFREEKIEAEMASVGGSSKALAALVGGSAQFQVGAPSGAFRARSKGTDAIVIAANLNQFATNFVMSGDWARKHAITEATPYPEKIKALKGMVVAMSSPGSGSDVLIRLVAKEAGLDPDRDVTITAVGTGDAMTAGLAQKRFDGFTHSSPVGENAIKNYGAIMFLNTSRGEVKSLDGFFYVGQVASEAWLKKNEDVAVRYLRAIQKALDVMHDPEQTNKARDAIRMAYNPKIDKDLYDGVWENTMPAFSKTILMTDNMIGSVVDFMNTYEKQPIDPEVAAKAWTNVYAERALKSLGRL